MTGIPIRLLFFVPVLLGPGAGLRAERPPESAAGERLFLETVGPLIEARCIACHGKEPEKLEGGLDLRRREGLIKGGESGPALVPGDPARSRIVIANRIWQRRFAGRGIVATPNNFGKMGKRPTHPELLDWLASRLIEDGWSLKKLDRLIMTSETYRRGGHPIDVEAQRRLDPGNELLSYFPPRRLSAEEIRDAMLVAAGELNREMGGPGVFPEIHPEVALQPRHIMGSVAPAYEPSPEPAQRHRRTIYAFRLRTLPDPMLEVFNRPGTEMSCERRDETTIAPQALALLNGRFARGRALALAARLERSAAGLPARVRLAFGLLHGRAPEERELEDSIAHVAAMTAHHREHPPVAEEPPRRVTRRMVEELTGEEITWEEELQGMEEFQPDLEPWQAGPETRGLAELCLVLLNSNEFLHIR